MDFNSLHVNVSVFDTWLHEYLTCSRCLRRWWRIYRHKRSGCWSRETSDRSNACVSPVKVSEKFESWIISLRLIHTKDLFYWLTNFSEQGKSKSLMRPKSSPVTRLQPAWETQAQLTSALSAFRGQTPRTSSPRMLENKTPESVSGFLWIQSVYKVLQYVSLWWIRCPLRSIVPQNVPSDKAAVWAPHWVSMSLHLVLYVPELVPNPVLFVCFVIF